ncbi:intercellular adhesion molecule 2 isoform X2 [Ictidomys tridecemlineatus]
MAREAGGRKWRVQDSQLQHQLCQPCYGRPGDHPGQDSAGGAASVEVLSDLKRLPGHGPLLLLHLCWGAAVKESQRQHVPPAPAQPPVQPASMTSVEDHQETWARSHLIRRRWSTTRCPYLTLRAHGKWVTITHRHLPRSHGNPPIGQDSQHLVLGVSLRSSPSPASEDPDEQRNVPKPTEVPKQIILQLQPVWVTLGKPFTIECRVPAVKPLESLTLTLFRGKETLHSQTFSGRATDPQEARVTVNSTASKEDGLLNFSCQAELDLRSRGGGILRNISENKVLQVYDATLEEDTTCPSS